MNKTTVDPCNVCGNTDVNLVDGFYYCVECGTQDVNVRQTVIDEKALVDGTFTFKHKKKLVKVLEDKNEMSGEWYKWHAYNFILVGLADELIAAGAKPSFKMKVLWLWTEYIKKFQNKVELGLPNEETTLNASDGEESAEENGKKKKKEKIMKMTKDLSIIRKGLLFSILHVALNLDGSDIQLSDLVRFTREGRLDIANCKKYIPKEIKVDLIPGWSAFHRSFFSSRDASFNSISLLKCFGIPPRLPDLRKVVDKFIKELCLPKDFKDLVFALIQLAPCDYLEINKYTMKEMVRFPAYECIVMSYVLVAFKMCFGLDDDYEVRLSNAVDKINDSNCHLKSYKLGSFSEPTERLFSFREWCSFIQLRKIILCKYYLHMAEEYLLDIDDYVYMEQIQGRKTTRARVLSDNIIMNMLDKIPQVNKAEVVPKSEFKPTSTPLSTYTDLILQYFNDPDLRLMFSEDFTQYSLKYAVEKLDLRESADDGSNIILGINETKKAVKTEIYGIFQTTTLDVELVYIRNCENKNWLKTNQPLVEHIKNINESNTSDKDSDHDYDSNVETLSSDTESYNKNAATYDAVENLEIERKFELVEEEKENINIFDDDFKDILDEKDVKEENEIFDLSESTTFNLLPDHNNSQDNNFTNGDESRSQYSNDDLELFFNPETFDREKTIRELILATCKKYKIKIPIEYQEPKEPKKRKANILKNKNGESDPKKPRVTESNKKRLNKTSVNDEINEILATYYKKIEHDILHQLSEHVKAAVNNANMNLEVENITENNIENDPPLLLNEALDDDLRNIESTGSVEINSVSLDLSNSVQCLNDQDLKQDDDKNKGDPKFDEREYDIKQLYVKVGEESDSDDVFDVADNPEIAEILDKQIEAISKCKELSLPPRQNPQKAEDFDDDIPLSVLREEKLIMNTAKNILAPTKFEYLLKKPGHVEHFKYWIREYASSRVQKTHNLNEVFHTELNKNYPRSFYFVIRECATMIETTPYQLYKDMLNLEKRIML